jgi:targeting protein for Xklp2
MQEDAATKLQRRPKLTLIRPKEPEFQTAHRVRAVRMKNSSELEEEMLAKIPKFRARPFNKKVSFFLRFRFDLVNFILQDMKPN